jgi:hypothetical protein
MTTLGFGQSTGQIVQTAYVVQRIRPAHMMIELIQRNDDQPSAYKEIIDRRGYGFHHVGIAFEDVEAERIAYEGRGAGVRRADPRDAGHGRNVHALLAGLRRLERRGPDQAVRLKP